MTKLESVAAPTAPTNGNTPKRRVLTRAQILAPKPPAFEDVPTDEWGEGTAVRVKPMDFESRDLWDLTIVALAEDKSGEVLKGVRLKIVQRNIIDESGVPQFTEADLVALGKEDSRPIKRCFDAILKLSKQDLDTEIEGAAKNSDSAPSEGRSTS